jgi:regulator of replication initiation timing
MKRILEILENEFEKRSKSFQEMYKELNDTIEENERLKKEIQILRNDLFELSKEYTNGK